MFWLVTRRRVDEERAADQAVKAQLMAERDAARAERDAYKAAAETAARQFTDADAAHQKTVRQASQTNAVLAASIRRLQDSRDDRRPVDGASPHPLTPSQELTLARAHARALEERLQEMTVANRSCTCQREASS